jgi:hypothetical protein
VSALADSIYLYATATGSYREGTLLDAAWPAGLLLIACAGWQDVGRPRPVNVAGRTFLGVPAACGAIAVGVLVAVAVGVLVAVAVGVLVALAVAVAVGVGDRVGEAVGVGVGVAHAPSV